MIRCYRCGSAIDDAEISSATICIMGDIHRGTICKDCAELLLEELTPAFIPGYSVSRLDILRRQAEKVKNKSAADILTDEIKELRTSGMTIPEIAQRFDIPNKTVMDFINRK